MTVLIIGLTSDKTFSAIALVINWKFIEQVKKLVGVIFFFLDFAAGIMPDERAAKLGEKSKLMCYYARNKG